MFSMIFFGFVFFILIAGIVTILFRRRKKAPLEENNTTERISNMPRSSGFNEPSPDHRHGMAVPADNKLSQQDYNDTEHSNDKGSATDRSTL